LIYSVTSPNRAGDAGATVDGCQRRGHEVQEIRQTVEESLWPGAQSKVWI